MSELERVKVLILYCKDHLLKDTRYEVPEENFCYDVLQLAEVLASCGGIECFADFYEQEHQQNWNLWTEEIHQRMSSCHHSLFPIVQSAFVIG